MNIGDIPLFHLAEQRLAWIDGRQRLLAQNIANADTPGWKPQDLAPFAQGLQHAQAALTLTNPMHMVAAAPAPGTLRASASERAPDGNAVSLDDQLAKVADTETAHDLTSDLYKKYMSLFRTAIGR
jgi:flagellar basal-body rod protein FlgB